MIGLFHSLILLLKEYLATSSWTLLVLNLVQIQLTRKQICPRAPFALSRWLSVVRRLSTSCVVLWRKRRNVPCGEWAFHVAYVIANRIQLHKPQAWWIVKVVATSESDWGRKRERLPRAPPTLAPSLYSAAYLITFNHTAVGWRCCVTWRRLITQRSHVTFPLLTLR